MRQGCISVRVVCVCNRGISVLGLVVYVTGWISVRAGCVCNRGVSVLGLFVPVTGVFQC